MKMSIVFIRHTEHGNKFLKLHHKTLVKTEDFSVEKKKTYYMFVSNLKEGIGVGDQITIPDGFKTETKEWEKDGETKTLTYIKF